MNQLVFGGGVQDTILHPIVLVAMVIAAVLVLTLPRRRVIAAFLTIVFLVPLGQVLVVAGTHFTVLRIVILVGLVRVAKEKFSSKTGNEPFSKLDRLFTWWAICRAAAFFLLWMQKDALINQCGFLIDALGAYFVLRWLIIDEDDIVFASKVLAALVIVIGISMLYEQMTRVNLFGTLGGVRATPEIREGRIRCQGVFQHSIVAGVFGATPVPLFIWLVSKGKARLLGLLAILGSCVIVLTSASSTPVLAAGAAILGLCCWPIRAQMRLIRISIVAALAGLAFVMKAPVWFVIAHIDVVGSSSGYHRALLVDQFIRNFWDWWLLGARDTSKWGYDLWDVQNQFVCEGELGGLITFVLFIMIVVHCFRLIGQTRRAVRGDSRREWLVWSLGAVLFAHCSAFFGSNYYDQIKIWWYASAVMISAVARAMMTIPKREPEPELVAPPEDEFVESERWEQTI